MDDPVSIYLKTIGLSQQNTDVGHMETGEKGKQDQRFLAREAALKRAHEIRQFEIELYWKRANYFWLLQAAVFAAVGLTMKVDGNSLPRIVPVALASLGVVTAWAGWLATYGSKFWQRNWEHHIDMLEHEFEGHLYKTVYVSSSGIKWSLTGISESLALCFVIFWVLLLFIVSSWANPNWTFSPTQIVFPPSLQELLTFASWGFTAAGALFLFRQGSGVKGTVIPYPEDSTIKQEKPDSPKLRRDPRAQPYLVRREPSIK